MQRTTADPDAWKRLVLQAMKPPAWLDQEGAHREIVLSTRVRHMRNLRGHRFVHTADAGELNEIASKVSRAIAQLGDFEVLRHATPAERDYLVACRLVSPDFPWTAPGRALALNASRTMSVMVGEEDHLRIQALTPGWSLGQSSSSAESALKGIGDALEFSWTAEYGFLASSAPNCGDGMRHSAMFHLIGLAHTKRLGTVIRALGSQGLVVRGLFGERSRAIGAFVQVSTTSRSLPQFVGACDYLLKEERSARKGVPESTPRQKIDETRAALAGARGTSLADAMRILAWLRWATSVSESRGKLHSVDALIPELALLESLGEDRAGRARLSLLTRVLGP